MSESVTIICTVLNEGTSIEKLLHSLLAQSRQPDEIIIVDGGSADNTVVMLENFAESHHLPLRVISAPGANISRGRNIAIQAASTSLVASTDAGVRLAPGWLAELVSPFESDPTTQVVAGFFVPDPQTTFEVAMGATVLPRQSDINPDTFLPSSRSVAFRKSAWQAAGGYPEWLDYCEDLIFDFRLRDEVGPFAFAPEAIAYFRPRSSLTTFFRQYYLYARGDGKSDLWRKRHAIRYFTYLVALPGLISLGFYLSPWWWIIGAGLGFVGMFLTPYRRLLVVGQSLNQGEKLQAAAWVPVIRITGDIAKMVGYPVGWRWRLQHINSHPQLRWR
jgi:glycosyltransferase involved in cell wall biosynthesis